MNLLNQSSLTPLIRGLLRTFLGNNTAILLLIIAALVSSVAPWLGFTQLPQSPWFKFVFSAMGILISVVLHQTYQLNELHELVQTSVNSTLYDCYPPSYWESLAGAKKLWISGLNLRRFCFSDHVNTLDRMIGRGGTLNAILLSSDDDAMIKYGTRQDNGQADAPSLKDWRGTITRTESYLRNLQVSAPGRVHIKKTDYPMPFGLDAVDIESPEGIIYVRYYPFYTGGGDKPILVLRANQSPWYDFYKNQLYIQWEDYATDLEPD